VILKILQIRIATGICPQLTMPQKIRGPLVIIHGEEDPVVPADHSRVLAEQITAAGGQVDLHLFPGEGHSFRQTPHRLAEYRVIEEFINRILTADG
jgi:dipeptidyl aminopeptidase/acylaminoacyl peptidase